MADQKDDRIKKEEEFGPFKWEKTDVLRLIEIYKQKKVLWKKEHPCYKKRNARRMALTDIAKQLNISDVSEVERKLKNLTCHYQREKKKYDAAARLGGVEECEPMWFAYKALSFLPYHNRPIVEEEFRISNDESSSDGNAGDFNEAAATSSPPEKKRRITFEEEGEKHIQNTGSRQEFELFGQIVTEQLMQLPLELALETEELLLSVLRRQRIKAMYCTDYKPDLVETE